jgi:hypothetical protein
MFYLVYKINETEEVIKKYLIQNLIILRHIICHIVQNEHFYQIIRFYNIIIFIM